MSVLSKRTRPSFRSLAFELILKAALIFAIVMVAASLGSKPTKLGQH